MNLEKEVLDLICEKFNLAQEDVEGLDVNAPLFSDEDGGLGLDSIDALELVVGLREHFGIQVTDKDMNALKSVATVVELIKEKKGVE